MLTFQRNTEFGYQFSIDLGLRKPMKNLSPIGRPQDLSDAKWLLTNSPAFKYTNPNLKLSPCCRYILKTLAEFVSSAYFG
jgi:hypothetical protein